MNILLRSKLALTHQHAKELLFMECIYVNRKIVKNSFYIMKVGDSIQINFNFSYLMSYQYIYSNLAIKQKRIKYCFQRWFHNRYDFYKQHTKRFPAWLLNFFFFQFDVPLFLEVDFHALTLFILRKPIFFFEVNFYTFKYINVYLMRLYNWKYLT